MKKNEFIKAKTNSFKPEFKQLIGLKESHKTSILIDFISMLHPNQDKIVQGNKGRVFGRKHFEFSLYTTGMLRTTVDTGERRFYPYTA